MSKNYERMFITMALKPDSLRKQDEHSDLFEQDNRIKGDLGDLPIVETSEYSDSDCSNDENIVHETHNSEPVQALSSIQCHLIRDRQVPVLSNVAINNSENVQFGNNTYFHGPVTIKQIISKTGIENPSYTSTENENSSSVDRGKFEESCKYLQILISNVNIQILTNISN